MHTHLHPHSQKGFSLLELSVVISIIALVGGLSLSVGTTQVKVTKIKQAGQTVDTVKTALLTYAKKAGRYPCPANPTLPSTNAAYGLETTGCDTACPAGLICNGNIIEGALPFKTIGVSEATAYDAWDNKLTYVIDKTHVVTSTYGEGTLPLYDAVGNEITASPVLGKAIFLLLSHGSDGKGAYKKDGTLRAACGMATSDSENCDGDAVYRYTSFNEGGNETTTPTYYQDFLAWQTQTKVQEITTINTSAGRVFNNDSTPCVINSVGKGYCWGENSDLQIGNSSSSIWGEDTPVEIDGGYTDWVEFSEGSAHNCGTRANGTLYCWGKNPGGAIGDSTTGTDRLSPVLVLGGYTDWTKVTARAMHTCGLRSNGRLYCWGSNNLGQLGDNTTTNRLIPTEVNGTHTDWIKLSAGGAGSWGDGFTCGIRSSGRLYCWGDNGDGKLGDNTTTNRLTPTEVNGSHTDWIEIAAGEKFTCGMRSSGRLYCWGRNDRGQIGDNTTTDRFIPTEVNGSHTDWISVSAGEENACGIRSSGRLYCWGANDYGQVGDNTTTDRWIPTEVNGAFADWVYVGSGWRRTCGLRSNGKSYCWGDGPVGDGTNSTKLIPTQVTIP